MKKGTIKLCNGIKEIDSMCFGFSDIPDIGHITSPLHKVRGDILRRVVGELEQSDIDIILDKAKGGNTKEAIGEAFTCAFDVFMSPEEASMYFPELITTKD